MTQALSLYLDALRFGAAFTVFASHWAAARYSGGLFWRVMGYGRTSVNVFFVLSGFLIGGILIRDLSSGPPTLSALFHFWSRRWWRSAPRFLA